VQGDELPIEESVDWRSLHPYEQHLPFSLLDLEWQEGQAEVEVGHHHLHRTTSIFCHDLTKCNWHRRRRSIQASGRIQQNGENCPYETFCGMLSPHLGLGGGRALGYS
jgi:hypothetical protein